MGYLLQQSSTAQPLLFMLISSSDHITGLTGKAATVTVTISKSGGSFTSPAGAIAEIANGWYSVAGNATDTATLGPLALHAAVTGSDPWDDLFNVVAYNPQDSVRLGLTAMPNAAAAASGGLLISGSNAGTTTLGALTVTGAMTCTGGIAGNITGNLSGTVGSVSTVTNIATTVWQDTTAGDFTTSGSIGQILKTGIPNVVPGAANGLMISGTNAGTTTLGALTVTGTVTCTGGIVGSITGNLSGSVGSVISVSDKTGYSLSTTPPTAAQVATAVWQDTTSSDFTTVGSIGKQIKTDGVALPVGTGAGQINLSSGNVTLVATPPTAAAIATTVWQDATAGDFTTSGSIGQILKTGIPNIAPGAVNGLFIAGTNAATTITTGLTTTFLGSITGNISGSVVSVSSPVTVTGTPTVNVTQVAGSSSAATGLAALSSAQLLGVVSSDGTATTTSFTANTTGTPGLSMTADFYATPSSVVYFYSGTDLPKAAKIVGYSVASPVGTFTITPPLPSAPSVADKFAITGLII